MRKSFLRNIHSTKETLESPFFVNSREHYCPNCNELLDKIKVSQIVNSKSEEAKEFDFSSGETYMKGNVKFIWTEFKCDSCNSQYTIKEIKGYEKTIKTTSVKWNVWGNFISMLVISFVFLIIAIINTELVRYFLYFLSFVCFIATFSSIREIKFAYLPILTSSAIIIEKIKQDRKGKSSLYYLNFELSDGSRKLIKVNRRMYEKYFQNEKGILNYKEKNKRVELLFFKKINDAE